MLGCFQKRQLRGIPRINPIYTFMIFQDFLKFLHSKRVVCFVCNKSLKFNGKKTPACSFCALRLRVLHIINTHLMHLTGLCAYALSPSSIGALRVFVLSCYRYCCVCRPPVQKRLI